MRGTVKIRNFFPLMIVAILFAAAGIVARAQDSAPAAAATAQSAAPAPSATTDTVPVTTPVRLAQQAYEMGMVHREERLFVDEGLEFFREAVKADPQFPLGHAALGYFTFDPKEGQ